MGVLDNPAATGEHRIFNIGDSRPVGLMDMIGVLERTLDVEAVKRMRPMQPGDVTATFADIGRLKALCGYAPKVPLEAGLPRFVEWYRAFQWDSAGQISAAITLAHGSRRFPRPRLRSVGRPHARAPGL